MVRVRRSRRKTPPVVSLVPVLGVDVSGRRRRKGWWWAHGFINAECCVSLVNRRYTLCGTPLGVPLVPVLGGGLVCGCDAYRLSLYSPS